MMRCTRIEAALDPVEAGRKHERRAQVWVHRTVGAAAFHTATAHWDSEVVGSVVRSIAIEYRRPGVIAHRSPPNQALVRIDRRRERRHQRTAVGNEAANEVVSKLRET